MLRTGPLRAASLGGAIYLALLVVGIAITLSLDEALTSWQLRAVAETTTLVAAVLAGVAGVAICREPGNAQASRTAIAVFIANGAPVAVMVALQQRPSWIGLWSLAHDLLGPPALALLGGFAATRLRSGAGSSNARRVDLSVAAVVALGAAGAAYLCSSIEPSGLPSTGPLASSDIGEHLRHEGVDVDDLERRYPIGQIVFYRDDNLVLRAHANVPEGFSVGAGGHLTGKTAGSIDIRTPEIDLGGFTIPSDRHTIDRFFTPPSGFKHFEGEGYRLSICVELLLDDRRGTAWLLGFEGDMSEAARLYAPAPRQVMRGTPRPDCSLNEISPAPSAATEEAPVAGPPPVPDVHWDFIEEATPNLGLR